MVTFQQVILQFPVNHSMLLCAKECLRTKIIINKRKHSFFFYIKISISFILSLPCSGIASMIEHTLAHQKVYNLFNYYSQRVWSIITHCNSMHDTNDDVCDVNYRPGPQKAF